MTAADVQGRLVAIKVQLGELAGPLPSTAAEIRRGIGEEVDDLIADLRKGMAA